MIVLGLVLCVRPGVNCALNRKDDDATGTRIGSELAKLGFVQTAANLNTSVVAKIGNDHDFYLQQQVYILQFSA